jgi:hypothetical protein
MLRGDAQDDFVENESGFLKARRRTLFVANAAYLLEPSVSY